MIFVDSGPWFAFFVRSDPQHGTITRWLDANTEPLLTTDYVIDETLTLMRSRGENQRAVEFGESVFAGEFGPVHYLTRDEIAATWDVFRRYADKEWSFTDCSSKVVMERLGIAVAASFDHHFRQFGTVAVVPGSTPS
jgi:uncharacterized protein